MIGEDVKYKVYFETISYTMVIETVVWYYNYGTYRKEVSLWLSTEKKIEPEILISL